MYLFHDGYSRRPDSPDLTQVYSYLRGTTQEASFKTQEAFYQMLWDGVTPSNPKVRTALQRVATSPEFKEYGLQFINRCYYTVCNPLHLNQRHTDLARLILQLEQIPSKRGNSPTVRHLRDFLMAYRNSEYYQVLKRHMRLVDEVGNASAPQASVSFGDNFGRYFFVYLEATQTPDIADTSEDLSSGVEQKRDLRLKEIRRQLAAFKRSRRRARGVQAPNPTDFSDEVLLEVIEEYRPGRRHSFRNQARLFEKSLRPLRTMGDFKAALLRHVIQPIVAAKLPFAKGFSRWLQKELDKLEDNEIPINATSKIIVFQKLLAAIIKHEEGQPNGDFFRRLLKQAGPRLVTSFLLNMTLACQMVRFDLERRFAHLFHIFEKEKTQAVQWLAEAFEHMNLALALNAKYLGYFSC